MEEWEEAQKGGVYAYIWLIRAFLEDQLVKNLPAMQEIQVLFLGWEDPWRREWQPTALFLSEDPEDRRAWQATVHAVTKDGHDLATNLPP